MVKINLFPERPEAAIWRGTEKALWIFWFSLPLAIFLWAKLAVNWMQKIKHKAPSQLFLRKIMG